MELFKWEPIALNELASPKGMRWCLRMTLMGVAMVLYFVHLILQKVLSLLCPPDNPERLKELIDELLDGVAQGVDDFADSEPTDWESGPPTLRSDDPVSYDAYFGRK